MATEKEMLAALDEIEGILATPNRQALIAPLSAKSLYENYKEIKKYLDIALPLIEKFIPVYGSKIVKAIRFLMTIADTVCPVV